MSKRMKTACCLLAWVLVCAGILAGCSGEKIPQLKDDAIRVTIDINATTYAAVSLPELFTEAPEGVTYAVSTSDDALSVSRVTDAGVVNIISAGAVGDYAVTVCVNRDATQLLSFDIAVQVVNLAPDPSVKTQIPDAVVRASVFADDDTLTNLEYKLDLSVYFDAVENASFELSCSDEAAYMRSDPVKPWLVTLHFGTLGEKRTTIYACKDGERKASAEFTLTLSGDTPEQLINGDFSQGFTGWNLDEWGLSSYNVIDEPVDIWGNNIDADGAYLYGFQDEAGTCTFTSSLFRLGGSGVITWKMAGNCTDKLQFALMRYNPDGEDEQIAVFNNWYYGVYAASGFIFREYYYQVDMDAYGGQLCYFAVRDEDTGENGFGFVNLDSIVTYYKNAPDVSQMYRAGYLVNPDGVALDYSDTSAEAFPADLSGVGYQLPNGDFESGYEGWYMTTDEKRAYAVYGSRTDIWGNSVNATGNYLYGYANEAFATASFHSSLFKVGGSGVITWKMAGNSTQDLQLVLMKYNPSGEDEAVATFNNWYFPVSQESGFIFREYYYQIDMASYDGAYFYFVVKDYRNADFGFICLDDIVTYYETVPPLANLRKAGFCTDPDA